MNSTKLARKGMDSQLEDIRERVRASKDVTHGTPAYWQIMANQMAFATDLIDRVVTEYEAEKAEIARLEQPRLCLDCGGALVKKHHRGRWPVRCDDCLSRR